MSQLAIPVLAIVFGGIAVRHFLDMRAKEREARLRVIEKAIDTGQLDRQSLQRLLGGGHPVGEGLLWRLLLAAGWFGLFGGGAAIVYGAIMGDHDAFLGGIIGAILAFAAITFPMAVRELEGQKSQSRS